MTSDGRASSVQEHIMPSGRQSSSEYTYHTAVPTRQVHKSIRARLEQHHTGTQQAHSLMRAIEQEELKVIIALQSITFYFAFIWRSPSHVSVLS